MTLSEKESSKIHKEQVMKREELMLNENVEIAKNEFGYEVASKVAEEEIQKVKFRGNNFLEEEEIMNISSHLPHYKLVKNVLSLQGYEYESFIKATYRHLISLSIPKHLHLIRVGEIETDMRTHLLCVLPSGKGKKNISEGVKKIFQNFNPEAKIKEPRTIHLQHLIGKMLSRKEEKMVRGKIQKVDKWVEKRGFLDSDLLVLEEGFELFNSSEKNDVDCRDAILVATDIYGKNLIMKQSMDNLDTKEETLSYYPYVHIISFVQPLMFKEEFVTKGLARRNEICYKKFPNNTSLDRYVNRLTSKIDTTKDSFEFSQHMKKINNIQGKWEFSSEAIEIFTTCHASLLEQGFRQGGAIANYTRIMEYPLQNRLLKMSALQSITNLRTKITKEDVELAYIDTLEQLTHELKFVEEKVRGSFDYGESWGGAVGKTRECLEELFKVGAINKETSIKISAFQDLIGEIYQREKRTAKRRYSDMKANGYIDDFYGQGNNNGVFLKITPKLGEIMKYEERLNPETLYFQKIGELGLSGVTGVTGKKLIDKSKISLYIKDSSKKLDKNTPFVSDIPDIPDNPEMLKSERDTPYNEDAVCKDIKPKHTKEEILEYRKKHPKTKIETLFKKFGANVMIMKREGLIK